VKRAWNFAGVFRFSSFLVLKAFAAFFDAPTNRISGSAILSVFGLVSKLPKLAPLLISP